MERPVFLERIAALFRSHPMVGILGPRQCGKTTLARDYIAAHSERPVHYFDLEDPDHLNRLADPKLALEALEGLDRHRRDPAQPRVVPAVAGADRPATPAPNAT